MKKIFFISFISILSIFTILYFGNWTRHKGQIAGVQTQNLPVKGMIIPHHDLARELLIVSISKLANTQQNSTIVVMSPNHFYPQSYTFSTSMIDKSFPLATDYLQKLAAYDPKMIFDQKLIENEHGVNIPMTYLQHYFPNAKFIPIAFSPYFDNQNLKDLSAWMVTNLPKDTLYIASVDFSHDNMAAQAITNNNESIKAISSFDYPTIYSYLNDNNEHLDSPPAIAELLMTMEKLNSKSWTTIYNSHGAEITNNPLLEGTSYVLGVFR